MLRWCPSSFHVSRGYGASYRFLKRSPLVASSLTNRAYSVALTHSNEIGQQCALAEPNPNINLDLCEQDIPPSSSRCTPAANRHFSIPTSAIRRTISNLSPISQRAAKTRDDVTELIERLRTEGAATTGFSEHAVESLVSLYESCQASNSLKSLTEQDFEAMLNICGTYSSSARGQAVGEGLEGGIVMAKGSKVYWDFIEGVVEDRCRLMEVPLSQMERYWRFRGEVYRLQANGGSQARGTVHHILEDYVAVNNLFQDETLHLAYFQSILSVGTDSDVLQSSVHFCDYVEATQQPSAMLAEVFLQFVLVLEHTLPPHLRHRLLTVADDVLSKSGQTHRVQHHRRQSLSKTQQGFSLATLLKKFTSFAPRSYPTQALAPFVRSRAWALEQTKVALGSSQPLAVRWGNLRLLARAMLPSSVYQHSPPASADSTSSLGWQTILNLSLLENSITRANSTPSSTTSSSHDIRTVAHSLWKDWIRIDSQSCPVDVKRTVISSFFKAVNFAKDESLLEECSRYCTAHGLWPGSADDATRAQALGTVAEYVQALGKCRGYHWSRRLDEVSRILPDPVSRQDIVSSTLPLLLPSEVEKAISLFEFASSTGLQLSSKALFPLTLSLAQRQRWSFVIPRLSSGEFSDRQSEAILLTIFRTFQTSRLEMINSGLAGALGEIILRTYSKIRPSPSSKFPVFYFFRLLIAACHGKLAVSTIKRVWFWDPSFFTQRCIRRYLVQLVHHRCPDDAVDLFKMCHHHFTVPQVEDCRRKLMTALVHAGATRHARVVANYAAPTTGTFQQTSRDKMLRVLLRRSTPCPTPPPRNRYWNKNNFYKTQRIRSIVKRATARPTYQRQFESLHIKAIMAEDPSPSPADIRMAVSLFVRHGYSQEARMLLERTKGSLDEETKTAIGNIIIHGWLFKARARHARDVRHLFYLQEILARDCGFSPDLTTVNILSKAIISHEAYHNPASLRPLFDYFIRRGYPAYGSSRREHGVPFGTSDDYSPQWLLPDVYQPIHFLKHVQPLYKTFVKHFHRHQDPEAAKTVIGILKVEKMGDMERREAQSRSRRMGIVNKRARERGVEY
ncbi:hypothetical protein D9611_001909 [Ephemerocybe angulata]|uniref:Uncharacterized protein n=1 Tax=Ephemerocybe angulata TaxID=980116 RepID=A0A8H5FMK9_9AGAR|nr:hypothetical protein D9611_001909 [Tulosesus angulatus]